MVSLQSSLLAVLLIGTAATQAAAQTELLQFTADWCGPCRLVEPVVRRLATEGFPVRKVDIDRQRQLAAQYRVAQIPCFVMLVDGREVDRLVGPASYDRLQSMLRLASAGQATKSPVSPSRPANSAAHGGQPGEVRTLPSSYPGAESPQPDRSPPANPSETGLAGTIEASELIRSSVRIRVEDASGQSYGTGTIIDARGDEALILTCGHLFRESKGKGAVQVDLFGPDAPTGLVGQVISYDLERDVALLSIRSTHAVRVARVADKGHRLATGQQAFSVGCNNGKEPTVQSTQITAIDRYQGPPNVEAAGMPVEGRSGGGLFDKQGRLVGVCFAADPQDREGLYAALPSVHGELDRLGLSDVYQAAGASGPALAQAGPRSEPPDLPKRMPPAAALGRRSSPTSVPAAEASSSPLAGMPADAGGAAALLSPPEGAALARIAETARTAEVICIIRPKDPQEKSEIIVLDKVSPDLLKQLTDAQRGPAGPQLTSLKVPPAKVVTRRQVDPQQLADAVGWNSTRPER